MTNDKMRPSNALNMVLYHLVKFRQDICRTMVCPCTRMNTDMYLGRSPGFGITVWAETVNGSVYLAEVCSRPKSVDRETNAPSVPEDLGRDAAYLLLEEICRVLYPNSFSSNRVLILMNRC